MREGGSYSVQLQTFSLLKLFFDFFKEIFLRFSEIIFLKFGLNLIWFSCILCLKLVNKFSVVIFRTSWSMYLKTFQYILVRQYIKQYSAWDMVFVINCLIGLPSSYIKSYNVLKLAIFLFWKWSANWKGTENQKLSEWEIFKIWGIFRTKWNNIWTSNDFIFMLFNSVLGVIRGLWW